MRPLIGVPLRYDKDKNGKSIIYIYDSLRLAIQKLGGDILIIPPVVEVDSMDTSLNDFPPITTSHKELLNTYLDKCDGFVLPGGNKFLPTDRYILEYAIDRDVPVLGLCLSMQMMSCYNEAIKLEKNSEFGIEHCDLEKSYAHKVSISKDSKLYQILGKTELEVNSFHKYHALENHVYKTVGMSEDGIIEAIEYSSQTFNVGLQWHPEKMIDYDSDSRKIMEAFIMATKNKKIGTDTSKVV